MPLKQSIISLLCHSPSTIPSPVQKCISKRVEVAEGLLRVHCEGIARDDSFLLSVHECSEAVSGWLWPNSAPKKILFYEIPEAESKPTLPHPTHQCKRFSSIHAQICLNVHEISPDKSCLSCWVLTHHQDHRFVVKVCVLIAWRMKVMERIVFFNRQQPLIIKIPQLLCHHIDTPECFRVAPKPPDGHGDEFLLFYLSVCSAVHSSKTKLNNGRLCRKNIIRFSQLSPPSCSGTFQGWRGCNQSLQLHLT